MQRANGLKFLVAGVAFLFSMSASAVSVNSLFRQGSDPVAGNPNGAVTVVEFFDYNCSHCANMSSTIHSLIENNPNTRFIFKDLPILGPTSVLAARAALAAKKQGQYGRFNLALFSENSLSTSTLNDLARKLGMNVEKFEKDMYSDSVTSQLRNNLTLARDLNIPGTPAFYIGKTNATNMASLQYLGGEVSQSDLQSAIDSAK